MENVPLEPLRATVCGLFPAVSVNVRVAARVPTADGVKVTLTVQVPEPARLPPQVFAEIAKSVAFGPEMAMLLMLIEAVPALLIVTDCGEVVPPTAVFAKVMLAGVSMTPGALPVPDNATVCGLFPAASVNVNVAVRVPGAAGVKVMLTVQLPEPARLAPQVFPEIAKSPEFAPEMATLLILMAEVAPLLRTTDCGEAVTPTVVAAKVKLAGVTVAFVPFPVPDKSTACGLFPAESVNRRVAVRAPPAVGVNVTLTVQLPEPARAVPQVFAEMAKSPAFVPEIAMLLKLTGDVPPLVNVTVCGALVVATVVAVKVKLVGDTVALAAAPVPDSTTACGLFAAESVNAREAVRAPAAVGPNVTLTAQLDDPASVAPHVFAEIAKSPAFAPVIPMLPMLSADGPPLLSVTVWAALVAPTFVAVNDKLAAVTLALAAALPVPDSATVWGLLPAPSVNVRVAARAPAAEGVNVTLTAQLDDPANVAPQVFPEIAKSPAFAPAIPMLLILTADVPPLVRVTVCAALVASIFVAVNARLAGATLTAAWAPVPESATVCGLFPAESLNVRVAVCAPAAEGVNTMLTVQVADPARFAPQLLAEIANSAEFAPPMLTPLIESAALPWFCSVTVCAGLLEPTFIVPKLSVAGVAVAVIAATVPMPDSGTVAGVCPVLSTNVRVAWRVPAELGAKTKVAAQLEPAARVFPHVLLAIEKSAAFGPEIATLLMLTPDVPEFVKVTLCEVPAEPTATPGQEILVGLTNSPVTEAQPVSKSANTANTVPHSKVPHAPAWSRAWTRSEENSEVEEWNNERPTEPRLQLADVQRRELHAVSILELPGPPHRLQSYECLWSMRCNRVAGQETQQCPTICDGTRFGGLTTESSTLD